MAHWDSNLIKMQAWIKLSTHNITQVNTIRHNSSNNRDHSQTLNYNLMQVAMDFRLQSERRVLIIMRLSNK